MSVHDRGRIRLLSETELLTILEQITTRFENDEDPPILFRHLPNGERSYDHVLYD
jgi:hypothetical protein